MCGAEHGGFIIDHSRVKKRFWNSETINAVVQTSSTWKFIFLMRAHLGFFGSISEQNKILHQNFKQKKNSNFPPKLKKSNFPPKFCIKQNSNFFQNFKKKSNFLPKFCIQISRQNCASKVQKKKSNFPRKF